jgi:hypothetical protein
MAGVDLQKPRMRAVAEAVIALGAQPEGFSAADLAERVRAQQGRAMAAYGDRKAAYDLRKLRCKSLAERIGKTRRYRVRRPGIRTLAALLILREQVIKPVLAGVCPPKRGRPPKNVHPPGCPLPKASNRDVGHTPNAKNRGLICGLYDKHVGFCFRIASHSLGTV